MHLDRCVSYLQLKVLNSLRFYFTVRLLGRVENKLQKWLLAHLLIRIYSLAELSLNITEWV
jgi:hypothetical protein